jgi:hypothetical protein
MHFKFAKIACHDQLKFQTGSRREIKSSKEIAYIILQIQILLFIVCGIDLKLYIIYIYYTIL